MSPQAITRTFGQQYRNIPGVLVRRSKIPNRTLSSVRMKFTNDVLESAFPHLTRENTFLMDSLDM